MMKTRCILSALLFGGAVLLTPPLSADVNVEGLWAKNCKKCHGADGKGETRVGKKLGLKDYTDPKVQAGFSDEEAVKVTKEGYVNEASGKEEMKPFGEKLSDEEIAALVAYVRTFAASE